VVSLDYLGKGPELCANAVATGANGTSVAVTGSLIDSVNLINPTLNATRTFLIGAVSTPTPTPTPTQNIQPTSAMKKIGMIYFDLGSFALTIQAKLQILKIAQMRGSMNIHTVLIYGNTDVQGGVDNTVLSRNRAMSVRKMILPMLTVKNAELGWFAATKTLVKGNTPTAYAKNRRVEIWVK
jgi:outer membrane protein OmpA-like peptidoglycan-associated protein